MLHNIPCAQELMPGRDWARVYYSRVGGGTKVSIHALHALLGLIT